TAAMVRNSSALVAPMRKGTATSEPVGGGGPPGPVGSPSNGPQAASRISGKLRWRRDIGGEYRRGRALPRATRPAPPPLRGPIATDLAHCRSRLDTSPD